MKNSLLLTVFLLSCFVALAQNTLTGKVTDRADNKALTNASIILLNQDSILKHFVRADEDGNF